MKHWGSILIRYIFEKICIFISILKFIFNKSKFERGGRDRLAILRSSRLDVGILGQPKVESWYFGSTFKAHSVFWDLHREDVCILREIWRIKLHSGTNLKLDVAFFRAFLWFDLHFLYLFSYSSNFFALSLIITTVLGGSFLIPEITWLHKSSIFSSF